jgi:PAS domain S-box-containing protein
MTNRKSSRSRKAPVAPGRPAPDCPLELYADAFHHAASGLVIEDAHDHTLVTANAAFCELSGRPLADLVGRRMPDLHWPADRAAGARAVATADETGAAHFEGALVEPDGSRHPVEVDLRSIRDADGRVRWRIGSVRSIRGRQLQQRETDELVRRMRSLSRRLETSQESERQHVAHALHEGLMQTLTGLNLALERVKHDLATGTLDPADLRRQVEAMQRELRAATQSARVTAAEIVAPGLEHLGLWPVLERHVGGWAAGIGVAAELALRATPKLAHDVALAGFRAVDQCLGNVALHAHAKELRVATRRDGRHVLIEIEDDGIGIGPGDLEKPGALGLLGATERLLMVGGELRIQRRMPRGTRVTIRLPVARAKADAGTGTRAAKPRR